MRAHHNDTVAYPPRGLSRTEAARYIGVGTTKFDEMVHDRRMPRPKRVDSRIIWDRIALDVAFSDLPDEGENPIDELLHRRDRRASKQPTSLKLKQMLKERREGSKNE